MEIISLESIIWCLRSLKIDEMTPSEKAIQSRIKEAFSYKVNARLWDKIMEGIKTHSKSFSDRAKHNHAGSNPQSSSYFNKPNKTQRYQNLRGSEDYEAEHKHNLNSHLPSCQSRNVGSMKTGGSMRMNNSYSKGITTRSGKRLYHLSQFEVKTDHIAFEIEEDISNLDPNSSVVEPLTFLIYPEGEKWTGVDGKSCEVDEE